MIKINIWLPNNESVGHASMKLIDEDMGINEYISWYPGDVLVNPIKSVPGKSQTQEYDFDGKFPDKTYTVNFLDLNMVFNWWTEFLNQGIPKYNLIEKNCCYVVIQALKAGGSDSFFPWFRIREKYNLHKIRIASLNPLNGGNLQKFISRVLDLYKVNNNFKQSSIRAGIDIIDEVAPNWSPRDLFHYLNLLEQGHEGADDLKSYLFGNGIPYLKIENES